MKKVTAIIFLLSISVSFAQSYMGYETDNFSGIHGVVTNPANIADTRVKVDINVMSLSATFANDYLSLSLDNLKQLADGFNFTGLKTFASDQNEVMMDINLLGTSFMFSLNEKHSIGLITRARIMNNYNNINGALLESIIAGFPADDFNLNRIIWMVQHTLGEK